MRGIDGWMASVRPKGIFRGLTVDITQYNKAASGFATDMVWLNDQQSEY